MAETPDTYDPHSNNSLAQERTDLAEDRNIMAVERTFAGWIRTSFAAIGIGLAFRAVFGDLEPWWLPRAIATVFIAAGAVLAYFVERRTSATLKRLHPHMLDSESPMLFRLLAYAVIFGSIVLIVGMWVLKPGAIGLS
ncbi:YidH family protein [Tsuneonella mangrovi]|uniref:YidH family protein n=1 Tax=Tsuneonella mangrovi TaxID=1982042 RepID=UPI000BA27D49|nr:DUF202 domain-containing protein [Tsuneonella mangrovi]